MDNAHGQGLGDNYRGGFHTGAGPHATTRGGLLGAMYAPRGGGVRGSNVPVYETFKTMTRGRSRSGSGSGSESGMGLLSSLRRRFHWSSQLSGADSPGPSPGIAAMRSSPYPHPYVYPYPYTYSQPQPQSQSQSQSQSQQRFGSSSPDERAGTEEDIVTPPNTTYTTYGRPPLGRPLPPGRGPGAAGEGTGLLAQGQGLAPRYGLSLSPSPGIGSSPSPDADRSVNFFQRVWRRFSTPFRSTSNTNNVNMPPIRPATTTSSSSYYHSSRRGDGDGGVDRPPGSRNTRTNRAGARPRDRDRSRDRGVSRDYDYDNDYDESKESDDVPSMDDFGGGYTTTVGSKGGQSGGHVMTSDMAGGSSVRLPPQLLFPCDNTTSNKNNNDGDEGDSGLSPLNYHDTLSPTNHSHLI